MKYIITILFFAISNVVAIEPIIPIATTFTAVSKTPEQLKTLVSALSIPQLIEVFTAVSKTPEQLKTLVSALSIPQTIQLESSLFITDIEAWSKLRDFLNPEQTIKFRFSSGLDTEREELLKAIKKFGYPQELLIKTQALMQKYIIQSQQPRIPDVSKFKNAKGIIE